MSKLILIASVPFSSEASFLSLKTNLEVCLTIYLDKNLLKRTSSRIGLQIDFWRCLVSVEEGVL